MGFEIAKLAGHVAVLILLPPFFFGVIQKTKALFAGRKGPPLLQVYFDLFKLIRKGIVISQSASFLTSLVPCLLFSTLLLAGLILPIFGKAPIHFHGDLILFAYLLAISRFLLILAALDVGSSFEGMGSSREAAFGAFTELAFFTGIVTLALITRSLSLSEILLWGESHALFYPAMVLLFVAFFLILLSENSRIPIDDPSTHLELTMIHEVMILDYSGPFLGWIVYGSTLKLFLFMFVTASLFWAPTNHFEWSSLVWLLLKVSGIAILIGVVESLSSRLRLSRVPQFLVANMVITLLALLVTVFGGKN